MGADYSHQGLDPFLASSSKALKDAGQVISAMQFENNYEIQGAKVNSSRANLKNFVLFSVSGSATAINFGNNTAFNFSSSISFIGTVAPYTPSAVSPLFALPLFNVYQGTAINGSNQIYPVTGGSIAIGAYRIWSGYDYLRTSGTNLFWNIQVQNISAGSQNFYVVGMWEYLQYNSSLSQ